MENLINAVRQAIGDENWFAALFLSLTLPDICGAMESANEGHGKRYKIWYNKYLSKKYTHLTADACWGLRNSCLHNGSDAKIKKDFERIHFVEPTTGTVIHNNIMNNVLQLQIDIFCGDLCRAVEQWLNDVKSDQNIINRITELMKMHPISSLRPLISFS